MWNSAANPLITSALFYAGSTAGAPGEDELVFVQNGIPTSVREEGKAWERGEGYLECSGEWNRLYAGRLIAAGDFHIKAKLAILDLYKSGASFLVSGRESHLRFSGDDGKMSAGGKGFGKMDRLLDKLDESSSLIRSGVPFTFEVIRKGLEISFLIDGKTVYILNSRGREFGMIAFCPWMSKMRIMEFSAIGKTHELPPARTQPPTYTIPVVDLWEEKWRHAIVEYTPGQDLGHPTTVLLRDNKTMFATYPLGHGGPEAVLKKSVDGGLTWSERLPVPDNWKTATNCPCLHRLTDPDGVERLFVFEGNGSMRQSVSLDNGETWTPFQPNGLRCVVAPITIVPIAGGRHLSMYHQGGGNLTIWQSISADGGLTWKDERKIAEYEGGDLCEPAVIRSPDGKQLAGIMRENSFRYNSLLIVSDDEGESWSRPVQLPASLTGARHLPRYAHDGRLVIPFRDTALGSPTRGDFAAWVGTYDDIINQREGQYRVRLLMGMGSIGYPGLELLPDGIFMATTYAVLKRGDVHSVVGVRFKMEELDEKLAKLF